MYYASDQSVNYFCLIYNIIRFCLFIDWFVIMQQYHFCVFTYMCLYKLIHLYSCNQFCPTFHSKYSSGWKGTDAPVGILRAAFDRGKRSEGKEKNNLALFTASLLMNLSWPCPYNTLESQPPLIFEGWIIHILKYGFLHSPTISS